MNKLLARLHDEYVCDHLAAFACFLLRARITCYTLSSNFNLFNLQNSLHAVLRDLGDFEGRVGLVNMHQKIVLPVVDPACLSGGDIIAEVLL